MAMTAEVGRRGSRVRSDCWIGVALRDTGGIEIELTSKVAGMYGQTIREQIELGCVALGIENAAITVEDQGALPFTIAARLEAAVKRADGRIAGEYLLPVSESGTCGSERERLRRSVASANGCAAAGSTCPAMNQSSSSTPVCTNRTA